MKIDVSNLTREELIQYIASLETANGELRSELKKANQTIDLVTKENAKLEQKFEKLQIKYNRLLKKVETKTAIIEVINHNKFYTKKESAEEPVVFGEADKIIKKKGRKEGSKNFENIDFESLVSNVIVEKPNKLVCLECGSDLIKISEDASYKINKSLLGLKLLK